MVTNEVYPLTMLVKLAIFAFVLQLVINFSQHSIQPFIYTQF